jgi:hypothetical protein
VFSDRLSGLVTPSFFEVDGRGGYSYCVIGTVVYWGNCAKMTEGLTGSLVYLLAANSFCMFTCFFCGCTWLD